MRLSSLPLDRRQALSAALVAVSSVSLPSRPASAAYTVVPTGTVASKTARLAEVQKLFEATPDDPYVFGEKAQLESDINALNKNKAFAAEIAAGGQTFCRGLRIGVPDMADAVRFWTKGCAAQVLSSRVVDGQNVTTIGYGPQSPSYEDGAKFNLELVEGATTVFGDEHPVQYIQLAIPIFRLSQVVGAGGELLSGYGWSEVLAPGGLTLRVRIDENRRDPFEFIALRTSNLKEATKHYEEVLGMRKTGETSGRKKIKLESINQNSLFENDDPFEPDREPGSVLMSFGEPELTTSLLLLPPKKKGKALEPGPVIPTLLVVGTPPGSAASTAGFDGVQSAFSATF